MANGNMTYQDLVDKLQQWNSDSNAIKDLDSFFAYWKNDTCSSIANVKSFDDIASKPSCDAGIEGIEDIVGVGTYFPPEGFSFCSLISTGVLLKNDLFLISKLDDDGEYSSRNISYKQLSGQIAIDIFNSLGIKSMAFQRKSRYAISSHNHNDIYSKVELTVNSRYQADNIGGKDNLSVLGTMSINTDYIPGNQDAVYKDVDKNPKDSRISNYKYDINIPKIMIPYPPKPMIGTLRFVGIQTISALISSNNIVLSSDNINVNPYGENKKIRDDYDGWVFPNGSIISNMNGQLSDAAMVYSEGNQYANIQLPNICNSNFLKNNPCTRYEDATILGSLFYGRMSRHDYNTSLLQHNHFIPATTVNGTPKVLSVLLPHANGTELADAGITSIQNLCANEVCPNYDGNTTATSMVSGDIDLSYTSLGTLALSENTPKMSSGESYPPYNLIPVMIYIGGETRAYYESLYRKYNN